MREIYDPVTGDLREIEDIDPVTGEPWTEQRDGDDS